MLSKLGVGKEMKCTYLPSVSAGDYRSRAQSEIDADRQAGWRESSRVIITLEKYWRVCFSRYVYPIRLGVIKTEADVKLDLPYVDMCESRITICYFVMEWN
jgi:hypothetical protein